MREWMLAFVAISVLFMSGCKATLSLMVQKDWALDSESISAPDAKTSATLSFTDDHFMDWGHKRREAVKAQLDAAKARRELGKLRREGHGK